MVPDLTLEVIYLNEPTDFKMEFELCSNFNVRFLSLPVKSRSEFLTAISKSVVRSRTIITVGSFNPLDKLYIPKIIAKATGYELEVNENQNIKTNSEIPAPLPKGSLPLVDENGVLCGCVLENNDQSIIMLTSNRELRFNIVKSLVCPYLKLFAQKKSNEFSGELNASLLERDEKEELENRSSQPIEITDEKEQTNSEVIPPQAEDLSKLPKYFVMEQPNNNGVRTFGLDELLIEPDAAQKTKKTKKTSSILAMTDCFNLCNTRRFMKK